MSTPMTVYYDNAEERLVYVRRAASADFWDRHWQTDQLRRLINRGNGFVVNKTRKYLEPGARVLEGGCGRANTVWGLQQAGFEAVGIDFAEKTVEAINAAAPEIDVRFGDVRDLPFDDASFDGYWSLGVIEHFFDGYQPIQNEMLRILKPGGYLFMTVPAMSPLRRLKARLGRYPSFEPTDALRSDFYQFALTPERIIADFEARGFKLVESHGMDGLKGLKDEVKLLKPALQALYDSKSRIARHARRQIGKMLGPTFHMMFFAMQRL